MSLDAPSRPDLSIFDQIVDRRGTDCEKWDELEKHFGLSPDDALPMWVADTDFRPPQVVQDRLAEMLHTGIYGYYGDDTPLREAVQWWMQTRHGWQVPREAIMTTHGLISGTAHILDALTAPGDGVVLLTPVYHAFAKIVRAAGRRVIECPLTLQDGRYVLDIDRWDAAMDGSARLMMFCSPHNPGGRVWSVDEQRAIADFCRRHDLILASDEIHHDLVYPGHVHTPMAVAAPEIADRLIMMTAVSKTFNLAGGKVGNVIITDPALRRRFYDRLKAFGLSRNIFGMRMATAAYSPEGAAWVDALMLYLDGNRRAFDDGINAIPGLRSMPMQATFLSWVDFSGTGMDMDEVIRRVQTEARIATNYGASFGTGGAPFLRFNIGTQRARVDEAVTRLQTVFADLQ